jgi:hypothetical protein
MPPSENPIAVNNNNNNNNNIRKRITLFQGSPASPSSAYPSDKGSIRTTKSTQH